LDEARRLGLDLIEVASDSDPPVCKIIDYGKYQYEQKKKIRESKKKQRMIQVKEIKLRPQIAEHDFSFKARQAKRFLEAGQKIKTTLFFRGREIVHPEIGRDIMLRLAEVLKDHSVIETRPTLEGKRMVMVLAPVTKRG
jgi:translation initiation factor IF-3